MNRRKIKKSLRKLIVIVERIVELNLKCVSWEARGQSINAFDEGGKKITGGGKEIIMARCGKNVYCKKKNNK